MHFIGTRSSALVCCPHDIRINTSKDIKLILNILLEKWDWCVVGLEQRVFWLLSLISSTMLRYVLCLIYVDYLDEYIISEISLWLVVADKCAKSKPCNDLKSFLLIPNSHGSHAALCIFFPLACIFCSSYRARRNHEWLTHHMQDR